MVLKREDFPTLTDEQWTAIEAEHDRRATEATKTATKNATKAAEDAAKAAQQEAIKEAIERERAKLEADEAGKLDIQRKEIEEARAKLAADRKSLAATKKLVGAGFSDEQIEPLLPLFIGVDDTVLATTVDTFVQVYKDGIKAEVDAQKQALLHGATPPANPTGAPVDASTAATKLLEAGDDVGAIDLMLHEAGYGVTPPQ